MSLTFTVQELWQTLMTFGYIGPGAGLSAIAALFAVVAAIFLAIFGFIWYPIRRLMRKRKSTDVQSPIDETKSSSNETGPS